MALLVPLLRERALWRRWTLAVTAGETAAFTVPAVTGAALAALDAPLAVVAPVVLAAGAAEGAILGLAQAWVLRAALPGVRTVDWVRATVAGAVIAWAIGLIPFAVELQDVAPAALLGAGVPLGAVLLCAMGLLQARVLGAAGVPRAGRWVAATAASWAAGLLAFLLVASPLWQEGQAALLVAAIGVLGGLAMAATVAACSGAALVRLLERAG